MALAKCNRKHFAKKMREARMACKRVEKDMQPLCKHMIKLAQGSMKSGYCQRAGSELSKSIRMAKKYPKVFNGLDGAKKKTWVLEVKNAYGPGWDQVETFTSREKAEKELRYKKKYSDELWRLKAGPSLGLAGRKWIPTKMTYFIQWPNKKNPLKPHRSKTYKNREAAEKAWKYYLDKQGPLTTLVTKYE